MTNYLETENFSMIHDHHEYDTLSLRITRTGHHPRHNTSATLSRTSQNSAGADLALQPDDRHSATGHPIPARPAPSRTDPPGADYHPGSTGPISERLRNRSDTPYPAPGDQWRLPRTHTPGSGWGPSGAHRTKSHGPGAALLGSLALGIPGHRLSDHPPGTPSHVSQDHRVFATPPSHSHDVRHLHSIFSVSLPHRPRATAPLSTDQSTTARCGFESRMPGTPSRPLFVNPHRPSNSSIASRAFTLSQP